MSKRWSPEERDAWRDFFVNGGAPPEGRALHNAIRECQPKPLADLDSPDVAHATSAAAMKHLGQVPHRHEGDLIKFVESVQLIAVQPWLAYNYQHSWPADVFDMAVRDAREAALG